MKSEKNERIISNTINYLGEILKNTSEDGLEKVALTKRAKQQQHERHSYSSQMATKQSLSKK
jgi:hypothetical protein